MGQPRSRPPDWRIPASSAGPITEDAQAVLLYVYTGAASVDAERTTYPIDAGEAVWLPPGVRHSTRVAAGAVVIPIFPDARQLPTSLTNVRTLTVPPGWEHWLVQRHVDDVHNQHDLRDVPPGLELLLDLVAAAAGSDRSMAGARALPRPRSREARNVADSLIRDPGCGLSLTAFAVRESISAKTLHRQFRRETDLSFSEWRTRARIVAAGRMLTAGREIGWTGRHAGYATSAGFTRAFQRHTGTTPSEFRRRATRPRPHEDASDDVIDRVAAFASAATPEPPVVAERRTWTRVNEEHLLLWIYQGAADVRIGTRCFRLDRGDVIWLPAGVPNTVDCPAGSIAMPLGYSKSPQGLEVDALTVSSFPPEAVPFLLHTSVSNFTLFEPDGDHGSLTDDLFRAQYLAERNAHATAGLTGSVGLITRALRDNPADFTSLSDWASHLHISPHGLGQQFLRQTGETFPRWRAHHRMDMARWLLSLGDAPGEVARQLGYASSASFANAFSSAHGCSPRRFQRRQTATGSAS